MEFDIVYVTYNSAKWIEQHITSLLKSDYDLHKVHLFFVDNGSSDATVAILEKEKEAVQGKVGSFIIHQSGSNVGFGAGNNMGASLGKSPYIFFSNIDTEFYNDTLYQISNAIEQDKDSSIALWELRQFPYEHPKDYNPITGETSWASGAAFVIRRPVFEQIGGFDEDFFMYAEDVDLSWRVRAAGYQLRYTPKAGIVHYCYKSAGEIKPTQYVYSIVGNLQLRYKFGRMNERFTGWCYSIALLLRLHPPFPKANQLLWKALIKGRKSRKAAALWRKKHQSELNKNVFPFIRMDYERRRDGAFWKAERPSTEKKVSVIIRTCNRPEVLKETLISIREQTYPNIEVIIVEDGQGLSRQMIESEFSDLNIRYQPTGEKVGRCRAGNIGLSLATGDYINFLDDDDVFYADHIETLVMALQDHPDYLAAYSLAFETPVVVHSKEPYQYEIKEYLGKIKIVFNKMELLYHNCFPIQAVMFKRDLYEQNGGFDETLTVLEDWNLWVRYATKTNFYYVCKTTSQYRVPYNAKNAKERQIELDKSYENVCNKHKKMVFSLTGEELMNNYKQALKYQMLVSYHEQASTKSIKGFALRVAKKGYHFLKKLFAHF